MQRSRTTRTGENSCFVSSLNIIVTQGPVSVLCNLANTYQIATTEDCISD